MVDTPYQYNAIFGRSLLNAFYAVPHHGFLCLKMPGPRGMIKVAGSQETSRLVDLGRAPGQREVNEMRPEGDLAEEAAFFPATTRFVPRAKPEGEVKKVALWADQPDKSAELATDLPEDLEAAILELLRENSDVFAWDLADLTRVSRELVEHRLSVDPARKPQKQKVRKMSADQKEAARVEVEKLLQAQVIREILHPEWLANLVLVKKSNGTWRMCVDFTDLNKACPKDDFPLSRIDQIVDSTAGSERLSFLDAYSGYHQVWMAEEDEPRTSFITPSGTYCFVRMPFGLQNARATFARLVQLVFEAQVGRNLEAYVEDIVVKSKREEDHLADLRETFANL